MSGLKILGRLLLAIAAVAVLASLLYSGFLTRKHNDEELKSNVQTNERIPVSVGHAQSSTSGVDGIFPANIQAYVETPIYARTNGYLKRWTVDLGAHVKAGQLLAEIDTPEVDQQLKQAEATLATAQANGELSRTTAARFQELLKSDGVSKQEVDTAVGQMRSDEGRIKSAQADVERMKYLQAFKEVMAPFAGTITARLVDTGALISAGTNTVMFRLADTATLRVYSNVPEGFSGNIKVGMPALIEIPSLPGKQFPGTVARTAGTIDPMTRTLLTEVQVKNPGEIIPGAYGQVTFKTKQSAASLIVPASALLFRAKGVQIATVDESGKVHLRDIKLGRDFGRTMEVASGLDASDSIIVNPSDSITEGTLVKPVPVKPAS